MKVVHRSLVDYIDHMGSDLTVVNAARVSFDKESAYSFNEGGLAVLKQSDEKLISYLARHGHWSPFAHTSIQIRVDAPIFVARQLVKHQVGGVWNEVSRRYVDDEPSFYLPQVWRKRAENKKQGSSEEGVDISPLAPYKTVQYMLNLYKEMLHEGVAPEQARMILPQNTMTSWYWTGSLMFFHRVFVQRSDDHAQLETQEVARQIGEVCEQLFPVSWRALNG